MAVAPEQKEYIRKKVVELGSIEAVKKFYPVDCLVDVFANNYAKRIFKEKEKK